MSKEEYSTEQGEDERQGIEVKVEKRSSSSSSLQNFRTS